MLNVVPLSIIRGWSVNGVLIQVSLSVTCDRLQFPLTLNCIVGKRDRKQMDIRHIRVSALFIFFFGVNDSTLFSLTVDFYTPAPYRV